MRAAPLAASGLLGLILLEILKWAAPFLLTWLLAALVIGLKVGLAITLIMAAIGATFFIARKVKRSRYDP